MSSRLKNEVSVSDFEEEAYNVDTRSRTRHVRIVNGIRISLNILALATGLVVLTMAADAKATYNNTNLPPNYLVSLWPYNFNIRPTDALIGTGAIVLIMTCFSFVASLSPALKGSSIRHGLLNVFTAVSALIGALVGMAYYYIVKASDEVDTIESWSCHWHNVPMKTGPKFNVLCKQTRATIALAIFLVPLEALIIMCTAYQVIVEQAINYRVKNSRGQAPRMH